MHTTDTNDTWIADALADAPPIMTFAEAAETLRVSRSTLYRWIRSGRVRAARLTPGGGTGGVRVPRAEVARVLLEAAGEYA